MKNNYDNFPNIKQDEKNNVKMNDFIKYNLKFNRKHKKDIKKLKAKNIKLKILLIILLSILLSFNSLKFGLNLIKEIKKIQNIIPIHTKKQTITIGFYDVINCEQRWRRAKKGYFYELPKYINRFLWVFLSKNKVNSNYKKFTHLKFRKANNFKNLRRAVVKNNIDKKKI